MEKKASDWGEWMSTVITFTRIIGIVILMVIVIVKIISAFAWRKTWPKVYHRDLDKDHSIVILMATVMVKIISAFAL